MTTKGQMKPYAVRMSLTASQPGENSQTNDPDYTIVSSILTDLIFRRNHERRALLSEPSLNRRIPWYWATCFKIQNRHNNSINSNINLDLGFSEITKQLSLIHWTHRSKSFAEKSTNRTASNWRIESPLARSKLPTNRSNNDPNNTIKLRDFLENQITREDRITVARAKPFFLPNQVSRTYGVVTRVLFKFAEPMPVVARVLFKLILYGAVVLLKYLRVEAFRNWHWLLLDSCRGKKAAEEERLHDTSPFTTSRLCMPLQLRNILDENYIAFFLSGE